MIPTIEAGGTATITTGPIIGFGTTRILVIVEIPECMYTRSQSGNLILFIVKVLPGSG